MRAALVIGWMLVTTVASAQDAGAAPSCDGVQPGSEEAEQDAATAQPACAPVDPRSLDAEACAAAAFDAATASTQSFSLTEFGTPAAPPLVHPRPSSRDWSTEIHRATTQAASAAQSFESVRAWGRLRWTIRALFAQARIYEELVRVLDHALSHATFEESLQFSWEEDCLAIVPELLALRAMHSLGLALPESAAALARLRAHGASRVTQCAARQRRRDPSFTPLSSEELAWFPGAHW